MNPRQIKITSTSSRDATVELDGHDISRSLTGVQIDMNAGSCPEVTLEVAVGTFVTFEGKARVQIDWSAHEALLALGWTPPATTQQEGNA